MQVGDLVRYNRLETAYFAIVLDTTCVQAKVQWFRHPSGNTFTSWVYLSALEVVA